MGRPHCVKNCVKNEKLSLVFAIFSWQITANIHAVRF